ncbi:hypothetical protein P4H65_21850 [Paenibacillus chitinolyticus]|uniref:hypothetical protein n=1 Tax=Paenibacillus chitinolyticus TaxID=79263 RepID=UPI002DBDA00A|nr:hypothetical protein [Paenibacillus chitinolyticus]MEC0248451.1 hypothetical protein [Paenibacillus chitinolyticus]
MSGKIPVELRKARQTVHTYERLKQCTRCGTYSVLWHDNCLSCGAERKFLSIGDIVSAVLRRNIQRDALILAAIACAAFYLARTFQEMALAAGAGVLLIAVYALLRRRYAEALMNATLRKLLLGENRAIRKGILLDVDDAASDMEDGDFKSAYEKLREIGTLITGSHIRNLKVYCLNRFILRSDMELELGTLIPDEFEPGFIAYLYEAAKVNPGLVQRDTLDYVQKYRVQIGGMLEGRATLALVAAAALRVKEYAFEYASLLYDFVDELPRERFLRLCRLVKENPDRAPELRQKVLETAARKYGDDPEFEGFL